MVCVCANQGEGDLNMKFKVDVDDSDQSALSAAMCSENTELVFIETDDGRQEVRLVDSSTGQMFELDPEVAEQVKRQMSQLSTDDLDIETDAACVEQGVAKQWPQVNLAHDNDDTHSSIDQVVRTEADRCVTPPNCEVPPQTLVSPMRSMPSLNSFVECLSSPRSQTQRPHTDLCLPDASPAKSAVSPERRRNPADVDDPSNRVPAVALDVDRIDVFVEDLKPVVVPDSGVISDSALSLVDSGTTASVPVKQMSSSSADSSATTCLLQSPAPVMSTLTAECSIKPCSDATATEGFVRVVITQPNGERITLNVPSQTLQRAVDKASDSVHIDSSNSGCTRLRATVVSCDESDEDTAGSPDELASRSRARRRASRGVIRAVAALRRTEDSDASFSEEDDDVAQQTSGEYNDAADYITADSMTVTAPIRHDAATKNESVCVEEDAGELKQPRIDALFRCVHCSTLWNSASELTEHVARVHDAGEKQENFASEEDCAEGSGASQVQLADGVLTENVPLSVMDLPDEVANEAYAQDVVNEKATLNVDIIAVPDADVDVNGADPWECAECDAVFDTEYELRQHNDEWHMPEVDSSSASDSDFSESGGRRKRRRVTRARRGHLGAGTANERVHCCQLCDKRFCTATALSDHTARFHDGDRSRLSSVKLAKKEFSCAECRLTYTSMKVFERHLLWHEQQRQNSADRHNTAAAGDRLQCGLCGEKFDSAQLLIRHNSSVHYQCGDLLPTDQVSKQSDDPASNKRRIGRPSGSSDKDRQHVYDHIEQGANGTFLCRLCDFENRTKNQVFYHVCTKHKILEGPVCNVCNRTFYSEALLRIHQRSHTGERPFPCATCGRAFRQNADLQSHIRSRHSNLRPFSCEICGKSFSRRYSRTVHMRCHTNERNYACPYCRKRFRASTYLTAHMRIHTGERPHACPICHKMFRLHSDIRRHIFVHSRDKIPRNKRNSSLLSNMAAVTNSEVPSIDILTEPVKSDGDEMENDRVDDESSVWQSGHTIFTYDDGTMLVSSDGTIENSSVKRPFSHA